MKRVLSLFACVLLLIFGFSVANFGLTVGNFGLSAIDYGFSKATNVAPIEPQEIIDTHTYLTDADFEMLYTLKEQKRIEDDISLTYPEAVLLMKIGRAEGGDSLLGQAWVMRTILNRVDCPTKFGSSVGEVVFEDGQFEVVSNGSYEKVDINVNSHLALAMIEGGWDETEGSLYFESASNSSESWHKKNLEFIKEVEGNRYYR